MSTSRRSLRSQLGWVGTVIRVAFASDTAVRATGEDIYSAEVRPGWDIAGHANGGYLLGIAVRADAGGCRAPRSSHGHRPLSCPRAEPGPASITTEVVKRGRTFTTVAGSLDAGGKRLLQVLGTFGDVSTPIGPERVEAAPPDLPPPDDCVAVEPTDTFPPPFMGRVDLRLHPDDAGFASGAPSGELRVPRVVPAARRRADRHHRPRARRRRVPADGLQRSRSPSPGHPPSS